MNSHFFSIQCFFEYNLGHFNAIPSHVDTQGKMLAGAELIGGDGVGAHIRVFCHLQWQPSPGVGHLSDLQGHHWLGELRRVVVDIEDVHLDAVELEGILQDELEVQRALGALPAQRLAVQPAVEEQHASHQVHLEMPPLTLAHQAQVASCQAPHLHPQVLGHVAHRRARLSVLGHGVTELGAAGRLQAGEGCE
uniref:Uncharacterized protein n=1 Tax=Anas platyrhynchos platyrhynchos TaxID=8840 RepID=A0A493TF13_ANAPP